MFELITSCISIVLTGLSSYMVWHAQNVVKRKTNNDKAMMLLMRRELRELHDKHMEDGYISSDDLGEFEEIYEVYHGLGGNGVGTVWKNDVERLERI